MSAKKKAGLYNDGAESNLFEDETIEETKECENGCNEEKNITDFSLCQGCDYEYCNQCLKNGYCPDCEEEPTEEESTDEEQTEEVEEEKGFPSGALGLIVMSIPLHILYANGWWMHVFFGAIYLINTLRVLSYLINDKTNNNDTTIKKTNSVIKKRGWFR